MNSTLNNSGAQAGQVLFSCVVPVKGAREYLDQALGSLREQGLGEELEVIVQDGDVEPDAGQSDALNRGFAKARGEWLFWLNADDVLLPGALKAVAAAIRENPGCDWFAGNLMYLDADGKVTKCACERGRRFSYKGFPVRVYGPSSFFRRSLFERAGGLDVSLRYSMDTDLWCRFRQLGAWYRKVPRYLWGFRVHAGSRTSGDLVGETPPAMEREKMLVDARYGVGRNGWPVRRLKLVRLLDGSYLKAWFDTWRLAGRLVFALAETFGKDC